jgi:cellulose 1,4-beta-cellobiosidase
VTVTLTVTAPLTQHSVALSWIASTSSDVVSYSAYRSTVSGGPYALVASAITGLSYSDASVQSGVTYYYVLTATDNQGQESVDSSEAKAVVPSPLEEPWTPERFSCPGAGSPPSGIASVEAQRP